MRVVIAIAALAATLGPPTTAAADEEIVAAAPNRYVATDVTIDQGEPLVFRNTDPVVRHDAVSDARGDVRGRYLFASDTIGSGRTSFVEGSQYLTAGSYGFFCSVHPDDMRGTLTVTQEGTPQPRPEPRDVAPPSVTVAYGRIRAAKLRRTRRLRVEVGADEAASVALAVRIGDRRVGRRTVSVGASGSRRVTLRLARRVRELARKGRRITVSARATDAAGNTGFASRSVKLS